MSEILKKLDSYQILTNLLPGAFFGIAIKFFFGLTLPAANIAEEIVVYYFIGLILNRIGSLVIEPVLKKIGIVKYAPYCDYVRASSIDTKIDTLSEMNNYTRSILTGIIMIPVARMLQFFTSKWEWLSQNWRWGAIIVLIIIFILAYQKQSDYVRNRVETVNKQSKKA